MCMCPHEHRPSHVDIYDISDHIGLYQRHVEHQHSNTNTTRVAPQKDDLQGVYPWYVFPRTYTSSCVALLIVQPWTSYGTLSACVCKLPVRSHSVLSSVLGTAVDSERVLERALGDGLSHELIQTPS